MNNHKVTYLLKDITSDDIKSSCDIQSLVIDTCEALLNLSETSSNGLYTVTAKYGLDDSGSHNVRHQQSPESGPRIEKKYAVL